jgi:23S rRNA (uracil1939-C5)-methyltransferase
VGQRLTVSIAGMGARARGVAHVDGFTLLIPRGLPGDEAEVEIEAVHPRYADARLTAIRTAAPERVAAPCPHFEACGGCDWLHVDYPRQLEFKRQAAEDQLIRIGKTHPPEGWRIAPSPETLAYRDRLEFTVAREGLRALPGFHGVAESEPVAIAQCHLAPPVFSQLATRALALLGEGPLADHAILGTFSRVTVQGTEDRERRAGLALTLHCNDPEAAAILAEEAAPFLAQLEQAFPQLQVVALAVRPRRGRMGRTRLISLKGPDVVFKTVAPERYRVPVAGFFQANLPQAARLLESVTGTVKEALAPSASAPAEEAPLLMDLFCGVGFYSLPLAGGGFRVVGVDVQQEAVRAAATMARQRDLTAAAFRAADLGQPGLLAGLAGKHGRPACVIVNPPRSGLPVRLGEALLELAPPLLVYVSCDGGTFARDVARLAARYELVGLEGFDMFPQTHHLELLGTLRLRPE